MFSTRLQKASDVRVSHERRPVTQFSPQEYTNILTWPTPALKPHGKDCTDKGCPLTHCEVVITKDEGCPGIRGDDPPSGAELTSNRGNALCPPSPEESTIGGIKAGRSDCRAWDRKNMGIGVSRCARFGVSSYSGIRVWVSNHVGMGVLAFVCIEVADLVGIGVNVGSFVVGSSMEGSLELPDLYTCHCTLDCTLF
jgi:hypothetical protein